MTEVNINRQECNRENNTTRVRKIVGCRVCEKKAEKKYLKFETLQTQSETVK